jgi:hypothetical protein
MECRLAGETKVLGENLPQRHFCPSQNPTRPDPGLNPGRCGGKPVTNCLSYGTAQGNELNKLFIFFALSCQLNILLETGHITLELCAHAHTHTHTPQQSDP